ncbi:activity-regulated cytoskeleton associated protein 2-like [Sitophilus oryzae]|uniref:Activity-regulated cytoskeleton associated protein 2-like n=1 Tax=Sitophilus oryzae TaxID=7048 RepID=A0A6J2YQ09_SITOR|nr:activity-regulated cytoskeleton associated protein 2-like [Sitophilus oryzae]
MLNYPLPPTPGPNQSQNVSPLDVRKWGVTFDGRSDPATFLEKLEEICAAQSIQPNRLLPQLPEVLQGEAALWYRNNRGNYRSWEDFTREFKIFYYPVNYEVDLEAKISRRVQKPNEFVTAYITDLQTLICRHGNISTSQELQWLYRNLLPEYRQYARRGDFHDISSFSQITIHQPRSSKNYQKSYVKKSVLL